MKKIPMRRCIVTGESLPKNELLRIVRTPEGEVKIDVTGKANGHGTYIKKSLETFALAKKKKAIDKALEATVPDTLYDELTRFAK
jgi:uncharacterized protein